MTRLLKLDDEDNDDIDDVFFKLFMLDDGSGALIKFRVATLVIVDGDWSGLFKRTFLVLTLVLLLVLLMLLTLCDDDSETFFDLLRDEIYYPDYFWVYHNLMSEKFFLT
jgi:hypothetical protein